MELTIASKQWAIRPRDERFLSLEDVESSMLARRERSVEGTMPLARLDVRSTDLVDGDIVVSGSALTHNSFGQLCQRVGAPAGYLRKLPAEMVSGLLGYGVLHPPEGNDSDTKLLVLKPEAGQEFGELRAITSSTYGRIWDLDVVRSVQQLNSEGRWKVPSASYASRDPKRATTLYASDHDVFLFLVDDAHPIEGPDGNPIFRGFIVFNSETGNHRFGLIAFIYQRVCDNRIIWGASEVSQLFIRHTSGGPDRFAREAQPALKAYSEGSVRTFEEALKQAKQIELGKDVEEVREFLMKRGFTETAAKLSMKQAEMDGGNPTNLWDVMNGLTFYAQGIPHTDDRVAMETKAGQLLELVGKRPALVVPDAPRSFPMPAPTVTIPAVPVTAPAAPPSKITTITGKPVDDGSGLW